MDHNYRLQWPHLGACVCERVGKVKQLTKSLLSHGSVLIWRSCWTWFLVAETAQPRQMMPSKN